ncbi:hypothetical protein BU26DRAFT_516226 [Trematosphaeria pertusa]|uniref:F-box domain-containing protein n=1 Tax=Trematosphaeria pertusa TaxID=390896 RepID=A0A6A6IXR1_9PLEO|nr:uncharacterized protein BU26DRAFT_516226 [Trematosphaeria pertusa]KAF2253973.1 hypothetical protein BU26DRAFT_516226 [Trematosphaeria pertusa]
MKPMHLPLELVLNVITCSLPKPNVLLTPSHPITQLLYSFALVCKETRRVANRYLRQHCLYLSSELRLRSLLLTIPTRPDLRSITALFLAPFGETIDDQPTATWVRELFSYTCTTLKRLIIDIPLRSLYPEHDHLGVRNILREGFQRLEQLEEFVSVRDELFLDITWHGDEPAFWRHWPKLRRLALYNPDTHADFWRGVAKNPQLETLVLTRADGLRDVNIKAEYFQRASRPLKVLLINVEDDQVRFGNMRRFAWDAVDPKMKMTIATYNVPLFEEENPIEGCQEYVKTGAEHGTLWDWEGEIIQHPPRIVQQVPSGA